MNEPIYRAPLVFGCDPELFFATAKGKRKGKIVGSERVIPETGLANVNGQVKAFVLDGVQVELNPAPSACRATVGQTISASFKALKTHLTKLNEKGKNVTACFDSVVKVDKVEMDRLSAKSKEFGCAPSLNTYDSKSHVKANAATYRKRAAGGHIHLGLTAMGPATPMMTNRERLVPLMDILVGNTCVLIDRNPEAVERRKNYGRAGEYRLPKHGLEYRTLSNFWLRSYPLFHLVMGLSRLAVGVLNTTLNEASVFDHKKQVYIKVPVWDAESDLLKRVDLKKVRAAINGNDLKLATENWNEVKEFIREHIPHTREFRQETGLQDTNLAQFEYFALKVQEKGLEYWFPEDPIEHWCNLGNTHSSGWELFSSGRITTDMINNGVKV